jgi:2'-5' RNA ligase
VRVFVAVWPPAEAVAHLSAAVAAARAGAPSPGREPRWVPAARWHLTIAFVGDVDDEGLAKVLRRTQAAAAQRSPAALAFAGAGRFGSAVLWAGLTGDVPTLAGLARAIGWQDKPFRAHLTLARGRGVDLRPWASALQTYAGPTWSAAEVTVVRSTLGPEPRYDVLEALALSGT